MTTRRLLVHGMQTILLQVDISSRIVAGCKVSIYVAYVGFVGASPARTDGRLVLSGRKRSDKVFEGI